MREFAVKSKTRPRRSSRVPAPVPVPVLARVRIPYPVFRSPCSVVRVQDQACWQMAMPNVCVCVFVGICVCLTIIQKFYKQNERPLHGERAGRVRARDRNRNHLQAIFISDSSIFFVLCMFVSVCVCMCVLVKHFPVPLTAGSVWISVA